MRSCLGCLLLCSLTAVLAAAEPRGLVVEKVEEGFAAHRAGFREGDILLSWERAAAPPANSPPASGVFSSPFEVLELEIEQAPRADLVVLGSREGKGLRVRLSEGKWRLHCRPRFSSSELETYLQAGDLIAEGEIDAGLDVWRQMASAAEADNDMIRASWFFFQVARIADQHRKREIADIAFEEARICAKASGEVWLLAIISDTLGKALRDRDELDRARNAYRQSLAIRRVVSPKSLGVALNLNHLGVVSWHSGDLTAAEDYFRRSLAIKQELAPQSIAVAAGLNNLGALSYYRGDLAQAESYHHRSLALAERLAPGSLRVAGSFNNLGLVAMQRGELASAEDYMQQSLVILERLAPQSVRLAGALNNLGSIASRRGELDSAEALIRRSLAIKEALAPQSRGVGVSLINLGNVAFERQDLAAAEDSLRRALAVYEKLAPRSADTAEALHLLGDVAMARGGLEDAESLFERSLAIRRERAPSSTLEAESCQRLGTVYRLREQLDRAQTFYDCALQALEGHRSRLGGSDETRSGFDAKYAQIYRQAIDLWIEVGEEETAFHILERYRARGLLALLGERRLALTSDLPKELVDRRRVANRDYDRAFNRWMRMPGKASDAVRQRARESLEKARRQQNEIRSEVHAVSPRLAALEDPQPLDLDATREVLDPGTLLLSYSVSDVNSYLFAVGPAKGEFRVFSLAIDRATLQTEVEAFRQALQKGGVDRRPEKVVFRSRQLSRHLLAPAAAQIDRAERLLIVADGPLHSLPFAALIDPGKADGRMFLVEAKPMHRAVSATVFGLLKQQRRAGRSFQLAAFGDPLYPSSPSLEEGRASQLRTALRSGLDLTPLPATRGEVEGLQKLYPLASRAYLGAEATEGRAKTINKETTHLHIATHGLLNDQFPLDSALAFSIPTDWQEGEDNGLLQAWEIFEQVRIDADLVTLSACDTGRGKVLGGEGLMGLCRAFQYAGARSVLASLWGVGDASTSQLMQQFYSHLESGKSKDEALRSAQLELLGGREYSHPFHWAGFELVGDWR